MKWDCSDDFLFWMKFDIIINEFQVEVQFVKSLS